MSTGEVILGVWLAIGIARAAHHLGRLATAVERDVKRRDDYDAELKRAFGDRRTGTAENVVPIDRGHGGGDQGGPAA